MTTESVVSVIGLKDEEMAALLFAAAQEVFTTMLGSELRHLPQAEAKQSDRIDGVLSLIGLAGALIGNGELVCTAESACDLSARLLGAESVAIDDQVLDAVGEIANMIIGGFKNLLETRVGRLQMSIPSVIYGKNIAMRDWKADTAVAVRCAFSGGELELRIRLTAPR